MFQATQDRFQELRDRVRAKGSQRLIALVLALLTEALLILAVISLGWNKVSPPPKQANLVSVAFDAGPKAAQPKPDQAKSVKQAVTATREQQKPAPQPSQAAVQLPAPLATPPAFIPKRNDPLAGFDLSQVPRQPERPAQPGKAVAGPANFGVPGDSKRVGTAPNGQPMYAASWYREPYDDELSGYLSTADGPGYALITCRTAPDFRVEDCVGLDEYPSGSRIQRSVLAAAWQFQVRPPRVGGVSQVGAWVRIRIDYLERPTPARR